MKTDLFNRTVKVIFYSALLHGGLCAQERKDSIASLDEVVVTATRMRSPSVQLPYISGIRTRENSYRQVSRTVPESLNGMPGVFVQKTNHGGGSPFIRGLTGNQTLILVDGIRLNNSIFRYGPNQYLTLIDPFLVDRVEVVKGTGSVQHGSDALTGVVNVQTNTLQFREKPQWQESISTRLTGSGMEFSMRPQVTYEGRRFAFIAGAGTKRFGDLRGGDTTGFQRPSGYRERSFDMKMMADLGVGWKLTGSYQFLQQDGVPVYHKYVLENFALHTSDPIGRGFGYLRLNKVFGGTHLRGFELTLSSQEIAETRYLQKNGSLIRRYERDKASTLSVNADMNFQLTKRWHSNTGVDLSADRIRSKRSDTDMGSGLVKFSRGLYPDASRYMNISVYSLHHLDFGRLRAEGGLRYSLYKATIKDTTLGSVSITPGAFVFQAGLNYRLTKGLHLYAQASEGYRAPNIDDLGTLGIVDFRYEVPAYDLRPERSLNTELGIKFSGPGLNASASLFRTNLKDLITRVKTGEVISGYQVYQKVNVDRGYIRGWEAQADYKLNSGFRAYVSATHLFGQSITRNEPLRRIPPFNSRLGIEYEKAGFVAGIIYDHADPQRRLDAGDKSDNRIPAGGTPGYNLVNLYTGFRNDVLTFRIYLDNIFDQDYRLHGSGINGMGRALSAMLIFTLKQ